MIKIFAYLAIFCFCLSSFATERAPSQAREQFQFTKDYFTANIPTFKKFLNSYAGKPNVNYLELGVYEGRSLIWVADNILTDPSSHAVGVDTFAEPLLNVFKSNLKISGHENKIEWIQGYFSSVLPKLEKNKFDVIYLDGGHMSWTTLETTLLAWPLLKVGGLLIFDDFLWNYKNWPPQYSPKLAVQSFVETHKNFVQILHSEYQFIILKVETVCGADYACMPLGNWAYYWNSQSLVRFPTKKSYSLTKPDIKDIEFILNSKKFENAKDVVEIQSLALADRKLNKLLTKIADRSK